MKRFRQIVFYTFLISTILVTAFAFWFFSGSPDDKQIAKVFPLNSYKLYTEGKNVTLFSLDPKEKIADAEDFRGFSVLKKVEIKDRSFQDFLKGSFIKSLSNESDECFNPRHGLRVSNEKQTVDLVICFECGNFETYFEGKKNTGAVTKNAEVLFNESLK